MKFIILSMIAVTVFQSGVLASQVSEVTLSSQVTSQSVQVTDQKFEPIYGQEPYQATCDRQVLDHTESRCDTVIENVCHGGVEVCETQTDTVCSSGGCVPVPRKVCHTGPQVCQDVSRRSCNNFPINRTEFYSCTQYRTVVVGQRLAQTYYHEIEVVLANPAVIGSAKLNIQLSTSEDSVTATLLNSFPIGLLSYEVQKVVISNSGSVVHLSERVIIDLSVTAEVLRKMESSVLSDLELGTDAIRFKILGAAGLENNLNLAIKLVRRPSVWFPNTILDTTLDSAKLSLVSRGQNIEALIPIQKLGMQSLSHVRYDLNLFITLNIAKSLNSRDFNMDVNRHFDQTLSKVHPSF